MAARGAGMAIVQEQKQKQKKQKQPRGREDAAGLNLAGPGLFRSRLRCLILRNALLSPLFRFSFFFSVPFPKATNSIIELLE